MPKIFLMAIVLGSLLAEASPFKPVSVSYEDVVRCFPELANEKISSGVNLDILKDLVDQKFVSTESWLRSRKIRYKREGGEVQVLTLTLKQQAPRSYELRLEKLDPKEGLKEISLSQAQRINPSQKQIDQFLTDATVQLDESAYEASKAQGLGMSTVRGLQGIQQLELRDPAHKKSISCNQEKDLGAICTCSKK